MDVREELAIREILDEAEEKLQNVKSSDKREEIMDRAENTINRLKEANWMSDEAYDELKHYLR